MSQFQFPTIPKKPGVLHIPGVSGGKIHPRPEKAAKLGQALPSPKSPTAKGPWGKLEQFPFFLEAPLHLLERFPLPNPKTRWFVNSSEASQVLDRMARAGLPQEILQVINQPANRAFIGDQIVFFPPPVALVKLEPATRAAIYRELRRFPANVDIVGPVIIANNDVDSWFAGSGLRPELISTIKQMSYPRGEALAFSDVSALMAFVDGEAEARNVVSVLTRTRTLMLKLQLEDDSRLNEISGFWGAKQAGSSRNVVPLLQSMMRTHAGEKLDATHLLPPIPRKLLYAYPDLSMVADGEMPDCHWTSLNFFKSQPEPVFLDARLASAVISDRYEAIRSPYKFGDILVFIDNALGTVFHSCVYVADDVIFTKNGRNLLSPWVFQTMDHVRKTYLFDNNGRIQGYRMKETPAR